MRKPPSGLTIFRAIASMMMLVLALVLGILHHDQNAILALVACVGMIRGEVFDD